MSSLDDQLKGYVRERLSSICHGENLASKNRGAYTYYKTIKELNIRLQKASENIRVGMIGELMVHIIIGIIWKDYRTIVPYFNLEDRNIKKGLDSIIYSISNGMWAAEVKSGVEDKNDLESLNLKTKNLLDVAHNDISGKLKSNDETQRIWQHAMNGFQVACSHLKDEKQGIENIIFRNQELNEDKECSPSNFNVILSSVALCVTENDISLENIEEIFKKRCSSYDQMMIISIRKSIEEELKEFLVTEEKNNERT